MYCRRYLVNEFGWLYGVIDKPQYDEKVPQVKKKVQHKYF